MASKTLTRAARWVAGRARAAGVLDPVPMAELLDGDGRFGPRWPPGHPHPELAAIVDRERAAYKELLRGFLGYGERFASIPAEPGAGVEPAWRNEFFPGLDTVALYGLLAQRRPKLLLEVGSGWSTRVARRAIGDLGLLTTLVSVDPEPRAEVDAICDEVVRARVEGYADTIVERLKPGDILFIDSSHRVLMGNDVTVLFLEVLPRLQPGVLVHVHDVFLPWDYPAEWADRVYAEQYLLAMLLLAAGDRLRVVLPNAGVLAPLWARPELAGVATHGSSFWFEAVAPHRIGGG
jgi:hypothetical protein